MNKTTTNLNQNNIFLAKENKQTNIFCKKNSAVWPKLLSSFTKLLSSLAQTAQQFGQQFGQTAEQFGLKFSSFTKLLSSLAKSSAVW